MQDEFKPKSFWERPEGTTGMLAIGAGAVGLFFAGNAILSLFATAVAIVGQAITLTILGAVLFALIMILTNSKFQTLVSYGFKSVMRKITGVFVEIDPIGIMKSYIDDLKSKRATMETSIGKLRGQIAVCQKQVDTNDQEHERSMATFKVAREKQMTSAATVASRQAGRLEKLNKESLRPLLLQMQVHLKALMKYYEVTGTVIDDLGNEVKAQEMQRRMITESYSAMSTAKKILNGQGDQREMFDQAMEYVVNDYGMKMGEIENFIENSKGFVEGLDLQNGVYEADALAKLQEWENRADSILLGNHKQQMLEQTAVNSPMNIGVGVPAAQQFDYAELLNNKRNK
jgi:hypothetical protein